MRLHAIAIFGLTAPLVAGCGSSWDIRKGDKLVYGCNESFFYPDADLDGWGDPSAEGVLLCSADVEAGLTAANGRDCDDGDPDVTGKINLCPDDLAESGTGNPIAYGGRVVGEVEFAFVHGGDAQVLENRMATAQCELWAGEVDGASAGSLATFASQTEVQQAQDAIDVARPDGPYAGFVGLEWTGDLTVGDWEWIDDSDDGLIDSVFSWCNGSPPVPGDFFPELNTADPAHFDAFNDALPHLRLAMVRQESGSWCLGLPWDAIPDALWNEMQAGTADYTDPLVADISRYRSTRSHMICRRAAPDANDFRHVDVSTGAGE